MGSCCRYNLSLSLLCLVVMYKYIYWYSLRFPPSSNPVDWIAAKQQQQQRQHYFFRSSFFLFCSRFPLFSSLWNIPISLWIELFVFGLIYLLPTVSPIWLLLLLLLLCYRLHFIWIKGRETQTLVYEVDDLFPSLVYSLVFSLPVLYNKCCCCCCTTSSWLVPSLWGAFKRVSQGLFVCKNWTSDLRVPGISFFFSFFFLLLGLVESRRRPSSCSSSCVFPLLFGGVR